jgi:Ca2+-binding RTX toxin-like protein
MLSRGGTTYVEDGSDVCHGGNGVRLLGGGAAWGDVCGDVKKGTNGTDRLIGDDYVNIFYGKGGDDLLRGLSLSDELYGNSGNDEVYGGRGDDRIGGGTGRDVLDGGPGDDRITSMDLQ